MDSRIAAKVSATDETMSSNEVKERIDTEGQRAKSKELRVGKRSPKPNDTDLTRNIVVAQFIGPLWKPDKLGNYSKMLNASVP